MVEKVRAGWGVWRWRHTRTCQNGHEVKILGDSTKRPASLPPGGILCPHCKSLVGFGSSRNIQNNRG
ncbi:MAG: hypothetical protein DDT34_01909 [Firmicutes bacterium]|nr:hypothetical protein [Bacillota bacterium]MBT9165414.1 hypothetical protein [Chloroflexota bacterium]